MKNKYLYIALAFILIGVQGLTAQRKIRIVQSDNTFTDAEKFPGAIIAVGHVQVEHEGAVLSGDQALIYKEKNLVKVLGNVLINQGDTITQRSKYVHYDGNTRQALSWGKVVLRDPDMQLTTDTLHFDRNLQTVYYEHHAVIRDSTSTLESEIGRYYLKEKKFVALSQVTINQPGSTVTSDRLDYYTDTGESYLYGDTYLRNKENTLYCKRGYYNSRTHESHFTENAKIWYRSREISGDSLYYDRNRGYASATRHIRVKDTINRMLIKGNYAEYFERLDSVFVTGRPVAIKQMEQDSLYMYADTLLVTGKPEDRKFRGYHRVKFYKPDFQGACDSIFSTQSGHQTRMFGNPVLWNGRNQITGDTIVFYSTVDNRKLDSLRVTGHTFVINKDSINGYNQMKGNELYGKFSANRLSALRIKGNVETLNYQRDDDMSLIGITHMTSGELYIRWKEGKIQKATYSLSPEGKTYPKSKFPNTLEKLKGFIWREEERPENPGDIYPE